MCECVRVRRYRYKCVIVTGTYPKAARGTAACDTNYKMSLDGCVLVAPGGRRQKGIPYVGTYIYVYIFYEIRDRRTLSICMLACVHYKKSRSILS